MDLNQNVVNMFNAIRTPIYTVFDDMNNVSASSRNGNAIASTDTIQIDSDITNWSDNLHQRLAKMGYTMEYTFNDHGFYVLDSLTLPEGWRREASILNAIKNKQLENHYDSEGCIRLILSKTLSIKDNSVYFLLV